MKEKEVEAVLSLKKLNVVCVIGTEPHERVRDQTIELDIEIGLNDLKALQTDELSDAVDYTAVAALCHKTAEEGKFKLLEALSYAIAKNVLKAFDSKWVRVRTYKPRPLPHLDGSAVDIVVKKG
jgi:dihydroneopterin aldolase